MTKELSEKDALQLISSQAEALVRHLDERCVGILGFKGDDPSEIGSGTCIALGGRFFIATATPNAVFGISPG